MTNKPVDIDDDALVDYYNAVPYESHPFPQSAVEHLEAIAFLFGLDAPAPCTARVLELGCAAGGNLIPFAARHPLSRCLGVDLSPIQIGQGQHAIARAGLDNIELRAMNLADIDASFGQFDYIICHGVYSWVPAKVQEAILRICADNLAPDGVVYLSYNTYPGWKAREIVRDAMILRGGPRDAPAEKLAYARGMLEFLAASARPGTVLQKALEENLPLVRNASSDYLLHEFLEPYNAPCYFKELVARANVRGLTYLAEAELPNMFVQNYDVQVHEPLVRECGGSQILMEQYLDFVSNRCFRQTLLIHQARVSEIRYQLRPERLLAMEYSGAFEFTGIGVQPDAGPQVFTVSRVQVTLHEPAQKVAAQLLGQCYPATILATALVAAVAVRLAEPKEQVAPLVMRLLGDMVIAGLVRFRRTPAQIGASLNDLPRAPVDVRSAQGLSMNSGPNATACNLWHESIGVSPIERTLLPLLDGTLSHEAMAAHVASEVRAGRLRFIKDGQLLIDEALLHSFAQQQVAAALANLQRMGFLLA
jgi:SAM-dependent methyltransferase